MWEPSTPIKRLEKFLQLSFNRKIYEYLFSGFLPQWERWPFARRLRRPSQLLDVSGLLEFCCLLSLSRRSSVPSIVAIDATKIHLFHWSRSSERHAIIGRFGHCHCCHLTVILFMVASHLNSLKLKCIGKQKHINPLRKYIHISPGDMTIGSQCWSSAECIII